MVDGLAPLNAEIDGLLAEYESAQGLLVLAIRANQAVCPHLQILHADWETNTFGGLKPLRLCACCRLEEESCSAHSSPTSWRGHMYSKGVLGNSTVRLIIPAKREDIYALRLPGPRYLVTPEYPAHVDD
jgi:hypothetical protein